MSKYLKLSVLLVFAVFFFSFSVQASGCQNGDLILKRIASEKPASKPLYTARLTGAIDVPNPNYAYTLNLSKEKDVETTATLKLHVKNPDVTSAQVITPIKIDNIIKIPHGSKTFVIEVMKPFNWGADYFVAEYPNGLGNTEVVCLKAEKNK